jgi:hypothetical protein
MQNIHKQIQNIQKYKYKIYKNTNTKYTKIQIQNIQKYKYKNTNTKIQIQKYKYKNTNTKIQIQKYKYKNTNTKNRGKVDLLFCSTRSVATHPHERVSKQSSKKSYEKN